MKKRLFFVFITIVATLPLCLLNVEGRQAPGAPKNTSPPQPATAKPTPKPSSGITGKNVEVGQTTTQQVKPEPTITDLIAQGKSHYRSARFKQALTKFEEALKQEPENDEALGLAAVTAFRLDNQPQSRDYFLRRAELPGQKDSVKAFCYYRMALTYWRDAHDIVAKYGDIEDGKVKYNLSEREMTDASSHISNGLEFVKRALDLTNSYAEAYNIKNLLHAEAALAEKDEGKANRHRDQSIEALKRAIEISKLSTNARRGEAADFSQPTVRIAQYSFQKEEDEMLDDPMMRMIEGGRPVKRVKASFPGVRAPKPTENPSDPASKGVTPEGGATSLGGGRGALTAAYKSGSVKIEVLVSVTGEVVFAHVIDGRSDLNGAAIISARSWRFQPAKFEGKPVQVSGVITFEIKP